MLGDWWTLSHSDAAWLIVIDRWALLAALVLPSLMHLVSCLACWRCCYYFVLLLAVRLLSCARGPYTYLHPYVYALLSSSHCPSGAQGGGPLALCYGSLHLHAC